MTAKMADEKYKGYRDPALAVLKDNDVSVWSDVEVETTKGRYKGIILPRSETADPDHVVLKLATGYNIGLDAGTIVSMKEFGRREANYKIPEKEFPVDPDKPNVKLFGTGGTIASRLDYRTGAVIPAFSPGELFGSVPELADICNLQTEKLYGVFSENMGPEQYIATARRIGEEIEKGTIKKGNVLEAAKIAGILAAKKTPDEIFTELYLATLSRFPTDAERAACKGFLANSPSPTECYEDLLWALLNSTGFLFIR